MAEVGKGSCRHWKGPGEDFFPFFSFLFLWEKKGKLGRQTCCFLCVMRRETLGGFLLVLFLAISNTIVACFCQVGAARATPRCLRGILPPLKSKWTVPVPSEVERSHLHLLHFRRFDCCFVAAYTCLELKPVPLRRWQQVTGLVSNCGWGKMADLLWRLAVCVTRRLIVLSC